MIRNPTDIFDAVCASLSEGNGDAARKRLKSDYPFEVIRREARNYSKKDSLMVFIRDGFIDRYSGDKLMFPGTLRVLSHLMPSEFPFHRNWRQDQTHIAYWRLSPTVDHVQPVSRGGQDTPSNWVTTSMLHNGAKSNWSLEELGWEMHPPGDYDVWDGQLKWFMDYVGERPELQAAKPVMDWYKAAEAALEVRRQCD